MALQDTKSFILGSGILYLSDFSPETGIPEDSVIETEVNKIGNIQGGASLEYKPESYQVIDDNNMVLDTFITNEEVIFKSGILTWTISNLERIVGAAEVTEETSKNLIVIKIGGRGAKGLKSTLVRFVHTIKKTGKKLRVTIVGVPSEGFTLSFDPKSEKTIDAVFTAVPHDEQGTKVIISKEVQAAE